MAGREDLPDWVFGALTALGGTGSPADVCREIWKEHEAALRQSGDLFYAWQHDVRWAVHQLRVNGTMMKPDMGPKGVWQLSKR